MKYTTPENIFETIRDDSTETGYRQSFVAVTGSSEDATIAEVFHPEQGAAMSITLPIPENNNVLQVIEDWDNRKLLGTVIRNDRLSWGVLNSKNHFGELQPSGSLDIIERNTWAGFTPLTFDGVEFDRQSTMLLNHDNQYTGEVIEWSVDALPFVINPNNDDIVRLDRYYDSDSDENITDGGSGTIPCETKQSEAYEYATEGSIKFYIYPRQSVRVPETDQADNFKVRTVKTSTLNSPPLPPDEDIVSRNWFDDISLRSKYFSENFQFVSGDVNDPDNWVFDDNPDSNTSHLDYPNAGAFLFKLDWGDGSPLEHTDKPMILESSVLFEHHYEKPGFYTITGVVYKTVTDGPSGGSAAHKKHRRWEWERFETNILLNSSRGYDLQLYNYTNFAGVGGLSLNSMLSKKILSFVGVSPQNPDLNYKFNNETFNHYNLYDRLLIFDYLYKLNKNIIPQEIIDTYSNYLVPISNESPRVFGCTDPNAENYNSDATFDDGTCDYFTDININIEFVNSNGETILVQVGDPDENALNNWDTISLPDPNSGIETPRPVTLTWTNGALVVHNTPTGGSLSDIYPSPLIDMFYPAGLSEDFASLIPGENQTSAPILSYNSTVRSDNDQIITVNTSDLPQDWSVIGWYYDDTLIESTSELTFKPIDLIEGGYQSDEALPITLQLTYQDVTPPSNFHALKFSNSQTQHLSDPGEDISGIYDKLKLWITEGRPDFPDPLENEEILTEIFWYPVDPDDQRLSGWTEDLDIKMIHFGGGDQAGGYNHNHITLSVISEEIYDYKHLVLEINLQYFMNEIYDLNQDHQQDWHYYFPYYTTTNGLRFKFYVKLTDTSGNISENYGFTGGYGSEGGESLLQIGFYPDPLMPPPAPTNIQAYQMDNTSHDYTLWVDFMQADLEHPGLNDGLLLYEINVWSDIDPETGIQAVGTRTLTNVNDTDGHMYTGVAFNCITHLGFEDDGVGVPTSLANHILNGELNYYVKVRTKDVSGISSDWSQTIEILVTTSPANLQGFAEGISQEYPPVGDLAQGEPLEFYKLLGDQNRYWANTLIIDPLYESETINQPFYLNCLTDDGFNQGMWIDGYWNWNMNYVYLADYQGGDGEVHMGTLFYREYINGIYVGQPDTQPTWHIGQQGQSENEDDWFPCNVGMFLDIIPEWLMQQTDVYYYSEINYTFGNNGGSGFARSYLGKIQLYEPTYGCTDERAVNYDSANDSEDGSCGYQDKGHLSIGDSSFNYNYINEDWDNLSEDDISYPHPITVVPPYDDRNGHHPPNLPYMIREYTGPNLEPYGGIGSNVLPLVPMYNVESNESGDLAGTYKLSDTIYGLNAFVIKNNGDLLILKTIRSDEDHGLNMANGSFHINHWDILDYFTLSHGQMVEQHGNGRDIYLGLWVWGANEYIDVVKLGPINYTPYHEIVTRLVGPHGFSEYSHHEFIEEGSNWSYTAPNSITHDPDGESETQVFVSWSGITGIQENQYNIDDRTITIPIMIDSDNIEFVATYEVDELDGDDPGGDGPDYYGCTDPEAINWDPDATIDDGTCQYEDDGGSVQHIIVLHSSPTGGGTVASKIRFPSFANNSNQSWDQLQNGHPSNNAWWTTQQGPTLTLPTGTTAPDNVYICIEGESLGIINEWDGWYRTANFAANSLVTHATSFTFQVGQGDFEDEVIHLYAKVNTGA